MNVYEKALLIPAYENYKNTNDRYFEVRAKNANELVYLTDSAANLADDGYIIPHSENINADSISIFDNVICFELTDSGIYYISKKVSNS